MSELLDILDKRVDIMKDMGITDVWKFEDAVTVVGCFEKNNMIILGGDLIEKVNGNWEYIYHFWRYNNKNQIESIQIAKEFLKKVKIRKDLFIEIIAVNNLQ